MIGTERGPPVGVPDIPSSSWGDERLERSAECWWPLGVAEAEEIVVSLCADLEFPIKTFEVTREAPRGFISVNCGHSEDFTELSAVRANTKARGGV